ncbi:MAG: hypothetical protein K940chlam5_00404 [Candidatus Anoxychlamydiales bacterium]|nr:hypothetical protein [Candidatus Anoxychlamydiales bacterium]
MKKNKKKSNKDDLFIYGAYTKIVENEKHYTVLQSKYKTQAAYWLLIIFAAIGIIFSAEESIPIDRMLSVIIICFIGIIGNCFFWYEDIIIQEKFLNINHFEATKLEKKYTWLPQVHHQHLCFSHKTMLKSKNIFYVGSNTILFLILEFALFTYLIQYNVGFSIAFVTIGVVIFLYFSRLMFVKAFTNELSVLEAMLHARKR